MVSVLKMKHFLIKRDEFIKTIEKMEGEYLKKITDMS